MPWIAKAAKVSVCFCCGSCCYCYCIPPSYAPLHSQILAHLSPPLFLLSFSFLSSLLLFSPPLSPLQKKKSWGDTLNKVKKYNTKRRTATLNSLSITNMDWNQLQSDITAETEKQQQQQQQLPQQPLSPPQSPLQLSNGGSSPELSPGWRTNTNTNISTNISTVNNNNNASTTTRTTTPMDIILNNKSKSTHNTPTNSPNIANLVLSKNGKKHGTVGRLGLGGSKSKSLNIDLQRSSDHGSSSSPKPEIPENIQFAVLITGTEKRCKSLSFFVFDFLFFLSCFRFLCFLVVAFTD